VHMASSGNLVLGSFFSNGTKAHWPLAFFEKSTTAAAASRCDFRHESNVRNRGGCEFRFKVGMMSSKATVVGFASTKPKASSV